MPRFMVVFLLVAVLLTVCSGACWEGLNYFAEHWLREGECEYDTNSDDIVDYDDFVSLRDRWFDLNLVPSDEFVVLRNSVAFDRDFNQVAANTGRIEDICVASRPTVTIIGGPASTVLDVDGDDILLSRAAPDYDTKLYSTVDGITCTQVVDISSDTPLDNGGKFSDYFESGDIVKGFQVMADGSWLLSVGSGNVGYQGDLFRSTNRGLSWSHVLTFDRGYTPSWAMKSIAEDNEVLACEYGLPTQPDNPRRIYYSEDYGATWAMIIDIGPASGQHCHTVTFGIKNTDVIYASWGDTDFCCIKKFVYTPGTGGKKNPDNWQEDELFKPFMDDMNPVCFFKDDSYIYVGRDAQQCPIIWRMDVDENYESVLEPPRYIDDPNSPYVNNASCQVFGMLKHEGVYYAAVRELGGRRIGGIYVSTDGRNWACAYRAPIGDRGPSSVIGYANGKIWGTYTTWKHLPFYFKPVNASTVSALRVERGITNALTSADASYFANSTGGWRRYASADDCEVPTLSNGTTEPAKLGNHSLKVVGLEQANQMFRIVSPNFLMNPTLGDYICASFWICGASTWPYPYDAPAYATMRTIDGGEIDVNPSWFTMQKEQWQKVTCWARVMDDNFSGVFLEIRVWTYRYNGDFSNMKCFIDCPQICYFNDLHYSGPWQVGGIARDNETAYYSLTEPGSEFTIAFEWRPDCSSEEWHGDIYIATINNDANHIDLYYDKSESKFAATDGTNTSITTGTFTWEHSDSAKFAITNLNGDFRLSVQTSLNYVEHVLTDNTATLIGSPTTLTLGTDRGNSGYGCGLFANVRAFDRALSEKDIEKVFDLHIVR